MTRRYAVRNALLCYLRVDAEPCYVRKIEAYLSGILGTKPPAVWMQLRRLVAAGEVVKVQRGVFLATGLDAKAPAEGIAPGR